MKKIRICYFLYGLQNGGIEMVIYNYLSRIDLSDYEITIISQEDNNPECQKKFEDMGAKVYKVCKKKKLFSYIHQVKKILKENNCNIIHTNMGKSNFLPCIIAKKIGIQTRISHSHIYLDIKPSKIIQKLNKRYSTIQIGCGIDAAKYIFGESKDNIVLYNPIDLKKFEFSKKKREEVRKKLKLQGKNVYGNVGRYCEQKNQMFLIDCFEMILAKDKKAHLLVIGGDGPLYSELCTYIEAKKIQEHVTLLRNRKDVPDLYLAMDIFLLPSLYEGFPIAAIEAQASNLPVVMSNTITGEAKINENVYYLGIEDSNEWTKAIEYLEKETMRKEKTNLKDTDFDLDYVSNKLDFIYRNSLNNDKKGDINGKKVK